MIIDRIKPGNGNINYRIPLKYGRSKKLQSLEANCSYQITLIPRYSTITTMFAMAI